MQFHASDSTPVLRVTCAAGTASVGLELMVRRDISGALDDAVALVER
jgi:hypothetical protein